MRELIDAFATLRNAPRAFWLVVTAFSIDAVAYFGVLTLMTKYLHSDIGLSDHISGISVSFFTGGVTLFMFGAGSRAEKLGPRIAIFLALALASIGRFAHAFASSVGGTTGIVIVYVGLFVTAVGEGVMLPVCYAAVKLYTDEKTNAMGYAVFYAMMNLGVVGSGLISPLVRVPFDAKHEAKTSSLSGAAAVNWVLVGVTVLAVVLHVLFFSKKVEGQTLRAPAELAKGEVRAKGPSPFGDKRFVFFIFMLLPVRTLFAHQWLTMPEYVLRAYSKDIADHMEWLVNWINAGIVFFGVPIFTALTKRFHVYRMMIIGTFVSAVPTFLLCVGPNIALLVTYFVIFSIGEALWSSRFYEYTSEIAPEGRVAEYMAFAMVPWLLAKTTTGLYSGSILAYFCPETGPKNTAGMWLIYGSIAMVSPIGLFLARRWAIGGMKAVTSSPERERPA